MGHYNPGQEGRYDGSGYESDLQGQRIPRQQFRDRAQQQQQQPTRPPGQRSGLPSQQRSAPQPNVATHHGQSRGQPPSRRMQPQDQSPQWPLRDDNPPPSASSSQRGPPPPRPPRPSQVPMLAIPKPASNRGPSPQSIPQYRPDQPSPSRQYAHQGPEAWQDDEFGSPTYPAPNLSRPLTGSSRASTSSNYSVPDFPVPQIPSHVAQSQSQVRRPPLGPPPSARRGPSSYYPQTSYVTPIVEETDSVYSQSTRAPHDSYASSNAIPIGIPEFYLDDRHADSQGEESPFDEAYEDDSPIDHVQEVAAVPMRQASVGRRSRPTLTTIGSNDNMRPDSQTRPLSTKSVDGPGSPTSPAAESVPMVPLVPGSLKRTVPESQPERSIGNLSKPSDNSGIHGAGAALPDSSSDSEKSLKQKRSRELLAVARDQVRTRSPLAQSFTGDGTDNALSEKSAPSTVSEKADVSIKKGSLAQRVGSRRPPRLNVDVVKEAEARGSLTSLPDLIARATRLASNLDRGRTASRLGMDWFGEERRRSQASGEHRKSGNSLSDILASFPPPGLATPGSRGSRGSRGMAQWPSNLRHSALGSDSDPGESQPTKRRCCGMPLWLFFLVLLLLLVLAAAAVVLPIVFIVLPRQHTSASTTAKALAACSKNLVCQNGGANIVGTDGSCSCLCVNGYMGSQCTVKSTAGCTTTNVDEASNVTVGDAIPRLLEGAQNNFSVPLNGSTILGMFASNNLSCASENALVTFDSLSARSVNLWELGAAIPTSTLQKRQDTTTSATTAAATSNGIVFDSTPTSSSASSVSSATATSTSVSSTSSSNSTMLDFARVAILYVMQDSGKLETAVWAQENLQDYFTSGTTYEGQTIDVTNITLATGYTANLQAHTITTSGGSTVGS